MEHTAYLLLGSNVGERKQNLEQAIDQIGRHAGVVKARSSTYETEPWGLKEQDFFLNLAIEISTDLTPEDLMANTERHRIGYRTTQRNKVGSKSNRY